MSNQAFLDIYQCIALRAPILLIPSNETKRKVMKTTDTITTRFDILKGIMFVCLLFGFVIMANAQNEADSIAPWESSIKLNGPRLGITYVGPGDAADILDTVYNADPFITQFGWQFENRLFTLENGTSGVIEYILLVGGLDQGLFLPNATVLAGLRTGKGWEFGAGPNLSLAGPGFAFGVGYTFKSENIFFPVNMGFVRSKSGYRVSLLVGFNARKKMTR